MVLLELSLFVQTVRILNMGVINSNGETSSKAMLNHYGNVSILVSDLWYTYCIIILEYIKSFINPSCVRLEWFELPAAHSLKMWKSLTHSNRFRSSTCGPHQRSVHLKNASVRDKDTSSIFLNVILTGFLYSSIIYGIQKNARNPRVLESQWLNETPRAWRSHCCSVT